MMPKKSISYLTLENLYHGRIQGGGEKGDAAPTPGILKRDEREKDVRKKRGKNKQKCRSPFLIRGD